MNRKSSMARFAVIIGIGWGGGFLLFVIGIITLAMQSGYSGSTGGMAFGGILMYLGGSLVGIGLFASLLQMTAGAVIEGLSATLRQLLGGADTAPGTRPLMSEPRAFDSRPLRNAPQASAQQAAPKFTDQSDEAQYRRNAEAWAQRNLSSSNYEWWTEMGKPNLMRWVQEGRPDFKDWIKANKA
ncbi:MAG: hypothetical protein RL118_1333 [Actinomycetota bacterium]|jgi:hypothetical protein